MRDKFKRLLFIPLMILPLLGLNAQMSGKDKLVEQELSWADVEGAWGYEVIIRSSGEEILRQQTEDSIYVFSLSPGEYEFSVIVLNKFKKIVSETAWKPLFIKEAFQPVVRRFSPEETFQRRGETLSIQAEVYQVQPDTEFFLTDTEGNAVPGTQKKLSAESVELEFSMEELNPGTYTLSAVDSSGLSDISDTNILTVQKIIKAEIKSVSEKRLVQQQVYREIIVKGRDFEEGFSSRIFMDNQLIIPYESEWISSREVRISLITGNITPGRYDLEISNPSGIKTKKEKAFIIEKAPMTQIIQEIPPENSFSILGGVILTSNVSADYDGYESDAPGFAVKIRQDLNNKFFWRIPGLRPLGIELGVDYTSMKYPPSQFYYNQLYVGFHIYYRIPLLHRWFLIPRIGGGISNLWIKEDSMNGETLQGELGNAVNIAFGAQKHYKNGMLLEFGIDYRYSDYTGGDFGNFHPWIMGGYRF
ncbi:MAG: hypothetical protein B6241_01665 [Spirochaetaceae bacterium 4572_59]|nr:MAG: hypothetical protein B6241_01665 [Spirochaetaceae bacterium 4572_59]